ncbi:arylsulfatase A [Spirosomataceae bacterium TFI 002]|nr:arylsulfatase A [Spirosomataceae bacterium TFI 002]
MRIKLFLCFFIFSTLLFGCNKNQSKPNVLIILTDDQGWGDLSLHKNPYVETPNIDKLANSSISFDRFYVSPLCAPTRASLLTGKYHPRTGTIGVTGGLERMNTEEQTLAEIFKENGYSTGCFGKWHNGEHFPENPIGQGFDEFVGFTAGHWNNYFDTEIQNYDKMVQYEGYLPDYLSDNAIGFIQKNKSNPFLCYLPLNTPHTPHQVSDKYFEKYKKKGLDDELSAIYGMVENIDDNVGKVLQALEDEGLYDNTIVIFMSDNGPNGIRFNGNMKGKKGSVDEGGVRSPLFVRWPNKWKEPKFITQLSAHIDILPTLISLCGLKLNEKPNFDGVDLSPNLDSIVTDFDREIYSLVTYDDSLPDFPGAIRTQNFRWVKQKNEFLLFDMLNDPDQKTNLINALPEVHRQFNLKYNNWFNEVTKDIKVANRKSIPIGYKEVSKLEAQAPQASFSNNIRFFEGHGWANDWLCNISSNDSIWWNLDSESKLKYKVYLKYTCEENEVGGTLTLSLNQQEIKNQIKEAFNPKFIPSPDRVPRKEAYEKTWKELFLGTIEIPAGQSRIYLTTNHEEGKTIGHIKGLVFELQGD